MSAGAVRRLLVGVAVGGALLAALPAVSGADSNNRFVCTMDPNNPNLQPASGTYFDVIVPPNGFCLLNGATVTHDVIAQHNSFLAVANTTIGHDLNGNQPQELATGAFAGPPGPVTVGHDLSVHGSDDGNGIGYDICDTTVTHDLMIIGTTSFDEIDIGDKGAESFCSAAVSAPDSVGNNLVASGNRPARLDIGDNKVGADLTVTGNQATGADGGPASIDVSDNQVAYNATCAGNKPPPTPGGDGDGDGPNAVGHHNNGCP